MHNFISGIVKSCQELRNNGFTRNGDYMIDPDGSGVGEAPVLVSCDMTGKNGQAGTIISHDSEAKTLVNGFEDELSYQRVIKYSIAWPQLIALLKLSDHCEQSIRYDCHNSAFWKRNVQQGGWESRNGELMTYWGGAAPGSRMCACGMTNSCDVPNTNCSCDANDSVWRFDEGYLSDKETLPVTKVLFGDTGRRVEEGYHTIGKLICYGTQL